MALEHLDELYAAYADAYRQWATAERPAEWNAEPETILYNPEYLEKASGFRTKKWEVYVAARDAFLEERKRVYAAFPHFHKVFQLPARK